VCLDLSLLRLTRVLLCAWPLIPYFATDCFPLFLYSFFILECPSTCNIKLDALGDSTLLYLLSLDLDLSLMVIGSQTLLSGSLILLLSLVCFHVLLYCSGLYQKGLS
jgi:hypothetical protein